MISVAEILVPLPLNKTFFYSVPEELAGVIQPGSRVLVPFNRNLITGYVLKTYHQNPAPEISLKPVHDVLDDSPSFSKAFLKFSQRLAEYYYSFPGELLQASLPPSMTVRRRVRYARMAPGPGAPPKRRLTADEKAVLAKLKKGTYTETFLRRGLKIKNLHSVLARLEKAGLVERKIQDARIRPAPKSMDPPSGDQLEIELFSGEKALNAAASLAVKIERNKFDAALLIGDPRARETVYVELIRKCIGEKKRALILLPEISLGEGLLQRLRHKTSGRIGLLHGKLTEKEREIVWRDIKQGRIDVIVGARSAILSPVERLGLIIVDEEPDPSYSQRESPVYDARIGARIRAEMENALLVSGAVYPSVGGYHGARKTRSIFQIETANPLFQAEILDDQGEKGLISPRIREAVDTVIREQGRVLIFCHRRGFSSFLFCPKCRYSIRCPQCDVSLTFHKDKSRMICHSCGKRSIPPLSCPRCGAGLTGQGGAGIEAIEEGLRRTFPGVRIGRFDPDKLKDREKQDRMMARFRKGGLDILLGTPLLAHRADLPHVPLVLIYYPEIVLGVSDFRSGERMFRSLARMINPAGTKEGARVLIRTANPDFHALRAAAERDYQTFYEHEIRFRRLMHYPPFSSMIEVMLEDENQRTLAVQARRTVEILNRHSDSVEVFGPAFAPVSRLRGRRRVQFLLRAEKKADLDSILRDRLSSLHVRKSILVIE